MGGALNTKIKKAPKFSRLIRLKTFSTKLIVVSRHTKPQIRIGQCLQA